MEDRDLPRTTVAPYPKLNEPVVPPGRWITALATGFAWMIGGGIALGFSGPNSDLPYRQVATAIVMGSASLIAVLIGWASPRGNVLIGCGSFFLLPVASCFLLSAVLQPFGRLAQRRHRARVQAYAEQAWMKLKTSHPHWIVSMTGREVVSLNGATYRSSLPVGRVEETLARSLPHDWVKVGPGKVMFLSPVRKGAVQIALQPLGTRQTQVSIRTVSLGADELASGSRLIFPRPLDRLDGSVVPTQWRAVYYDGQPGDH